MADASGRRAGPGLVPVGRCPGVRPASVGARQRAPRWR